MNWLKKCITAVLIAALQVNSQSAAQLLSDYEMISLKKVESIADSSFSGIAFDPNTNTVLIVDDGTNKVLELNTSGEVLSEIKLRSFIDIEGIAYQNGSYFLISEERKGNVVRIKMPKGRSGSIKKDDCQLLNISQGEEWANSGLEDVAYVDKEKKGYTVKEKGPSILYSIEFDSDGNPESYKEMKDFSWDGYEGDVAGLYVLDDGNFLILNEICKKLIGMDQHGKVLSELDLKEMNQPEGITFDPKEKTIYITGEPREFAVFKSKENPVKQKIQLTDGSRANRSSSLWFNQNPYLQNISPEMTLFNLQGKVLKKTKRPAGQLIIIDNKTLKK